MFQLKYIILSISCLIFLSINAAEHNNNKSCGTRAWAAARTVALKAGKVGWHTSKGIVIGGCVGASVGGSVGALYACNKVGQVGCDYTTPAFIILGIIGGCFDGVILGGGVGFTYGMWYSIKTT